MFQLNSEKLEDLQIEIARKVASNYALDSGKRLAYSAAWEALECYFNYLENRSTEEV